jgi:hypothetical protein
MKLAGQARHLEVQLLADQYWDAISLFGRDRSVQQRHQTHHDTGTPTSTVTLMDNTTATPASMLSTPTMVPNPKGQGVLKSLSMKQSARRNLAIACLPCRERKIACGAPPVGSADTTCKYVCSLIPIVEIE